MKFLRFSRPSPAMAVSIAALVVALGGTSYAAAKIQTQDIAQQAVTSGKIRNDNVRAADIKNGSLKNKDFRDQTRWALVDSAGVIVAQSGGFEVEAAYVTLPNTAPLGQPSNALRANGNVYIDTGDDLSNNGITATVALQNQVDQNADGIMSGRALGPDNNPEFSGEIAVSQCGMLPGTPGSLTACAPPGTNFPEYVVVSPRLSDGSVTNDTNRKRFYVFVTGDATNAVPER